MNLNRVVLIGIIIFMILTIGYINSNKIDNTYENQRENNIAVLFNDEKNKKVNEKEAIQKVKEYMHQTGSYIPPVIEVDSINGNYYVVHAYEIVTNGDESHTATTGWFHVNIHTGEVSDIMN
jgi:hypothetical protein